MRPVIALLLFCVGASLAADADFNGRWNITVKGEPRARAWWLEVSGAGTPGVAGKFVGAPGGDMDVIPKIRVESGGLQFEFERRYRFGAPDQFDKVRRGVYRARLVNGRLEGDFGVDGTLALTWTGVRAPVIADRDDGTWREGRPIELFNGLDVSGWNPLVPGQDLGWKVQNGVLVNVAGANNLVSEKKFWNFALHVEFRLGAKSNSGIGLRGRYEVQIIDDFGRPPGSHGNGALYSRIVPAVNASKKPGEWQTYDIRLIGRDVTIALNGTKLIDRKEVEGLTAIASDPNEDAPGPIVVQGDHGSVEFRKFTLTPLEKAGAKARTTH